MERTNRGFSRFTFKNYEGESIIIQESSNATENCIWLGAENLKLIKWENPYAKGKYTTLTEEELQFFQGNESLEYSREDIKKILPVLQQFAETGTIDIKHEEQSKRKYYNNPDMLQVLKIVFHDANKIYLDSDSDWYIEMDKHSAYYINIYGYIYDASVIEEPTPLTANWQLHLMELGYWPCLEKYGFIESE